MRVMALALGGCICADPAYGITEDTGGHITYILGAMGALSRRSDVIEAEVVTRLFDDPELGTIHAQPVERISDSLRITRIDSGNRDYLSKEALARDRTAFTEALIAELRSRPHLPDIIHAHFSDAADVALKVRDALGIPFIYTAHSLAHDKAAAMGQPCETMATRLAEEDRAIGQANIVVGSSRDECERQLLAYPSADETRIERICPGIDQTPADEGDIRAAGELIAPFLRDTNKPVILAIARPVAKKNLARLVEAYGNSDALQQLANLVILPGLRRSVESGEAEQLAVMRELIDLIDRFDLHGKVAYPRQHNASSVRGLYALAARSHGVFVNPALTEPFGLTLLEAAVHALPVVATWHGGPADIVADIGHGTLVDPADRQAIAEQVAALLSNRARWQRASDNARRNIKSVLWDSYAAHFMKVAAPLRKPRFGPARVSHSPPRLLLLCDIDGTLTGCRSSALKFSAMLARRADIAFGVATGRSLPEARRMLREWNLPDPQVLVTSVGTEIHWQRGAALERDLAYARTISDDWDPARVEQAIRLAEYVTPQAGVDQRTYKRSYFTSDSGDVGRVASLLEEAACHVRMVHSHDRLLDILPRKAGKAAAMRYIAGALGLPMSAVVAAGDSGNDRDMLEACPNAVLVANHEVGLADLHRLPSVYVSRQPHAGGVIEGLRAYERVSAPARLEHAA